jgi:hypothetical protein
MSGTETPSLKVVSIPRVKPQEVIPMKGKKQKQTYKVIAKDKKAKPEAKKEVPKKDISSAESHREICYKVLKDHGKPMHYKKIMDEVLKIGISKGLTPQNSIFARMTTDNKNRFKKMGKGMFSLAEWDKKIQEVKANAN